MSSFRRTGSTYLANTGLGSSKMRYTQSASNLPESQKGGRRVVPREPPHRPHADLPRGEALVVERLLQDGDAARIAQEPGTRV